MTNDTAASRDVIRRFSLSRIIEHWVQIVLFFVLLSTGLSQKYHSADLSLWLIIHLGGIDNVRIIHRYAGLLFTVAVLGHVFAAFIGIAWGRWQPSLLILKKDFDDAIHNVRYYIGLEHRQAAGGKYTYKQKFEYWGILTGALLMILTGAMLWKPVLVTRLLPGEVIPASKVLHSNEALVVFLIIAIWHIYNSIFSPEVFPLNASIFTGSISRDQMVREHLLYLAELEGQTPEGIMASEHQKAPAAARPDE